ncbi:MAG: hypothetical protein NC548_40630 [Lachnospiraceae bacterium]|nr:hypothetical protein [Lachnospiraceae bacterium]
MRLDRDLTAKMFECKTPEEVKAIVESGADLLTVSRMALDEVLNRIYKKRCTGLKELAVKMLVGAVNGEDIPDEPVTPNLNPPTPQPGIPQLDPEERIKRIKARVTELVFETKDHFVWVTKLRRDGDLKMLGTSDEDLKTIFTAEDTVVCGLGDGGKKLYMMERNARTMEDLSSKWGDQYF